MQAPAVYVRDFSKGLWRENPVLIQLIGMCPVLAVTTSLDNGVAMGLATTFVLACSNVIISLLKRFISPQTRIVVFVLVIATFVTLADLALAAYFPAQSKLLGAFVPLIVVNCLIISRQEIFSTKYSVGRSLLDGLGMGIGFLIALSILSTVREVLGAGSIFGYRVLPEWYPNMVGMLLPAGAFVSLGLIIGLIKHLQKGR